MNLQIIIRKLKDNLFKGYYLEKYIINDGKNHPVAIICPGGGYSRVCSFVEGLPFAKRLNRMGYSAIVVHYRCGANAPYPAPQQDLARAVREIFDHQAEWKLDMAGYSVWGSSAGGHLAASFGTANMGYPAHDLPKPGALILIYPVITMGDKTHLGSRSNLLGPNPEPAMVDFASVEKQVTEAYPPTFLWCGLADQTVDPENSRMLARALEENDIPHEFLPVPGVGHGVGLGEGLPCEGWLEKAVAFWDQHRKGDGWS